jgi:hypothetical protein
VRSSCLRIRATFRTLSWKGPLPSAVDVHLSASVPSCPSSLTAVQRWKKVANRDVRDFG